MDLQEKPRTRDPESTVEKLLDAALHLFAESGYERATVDQIVQVAGYSKGAFYAHFVNKEEIFLAILERRLKGNLARIQHLCKLEGSASSWVKQILETLLTFSRENADVRALSVEFMAHGMRRKEIGERISDMHARWRELFSDTLRKSDEFKRGVMKAQPEAIAYAMVAMVDGFILQLGMEDDPIGKRELLDKLEPLIDAWFVEA